MKFIEDAFVLIHIHISHIKIVSVSLRHIVSGFFIVFILSNTIRLFQMGDIQQNVFGFIEAAIFIVATIYVALIWLLSWPKANRMLNKASEYEKKHSKKSSSKSST